MSNDSTTFLDQGSVLLLRLFHDRFDRWFNPMTSDKALHNKGKGGRLLRYEFTV